MRGAMDGVGRLAGRRVRGGIVALVAGALLASAPVFADPSASRPNILLIKIEDTNDWVEGFGGHPDTRTPNLAALAARGVRFDNAHTPSPLCNPAKTAILSGLAPARTGVLANQQTPFRAWLPEFSRTVFEFFLERGYYVAAKGLIFHQDVDTEAEPWSELPPYAWYRGAPPVQPLNGLPELLAISPGFDWGPTNGAVSQWGDYQIASYGIQFLNRSHESPFVLALGFTMPHVQWWVPRAYWDAFPAEPALPPWLPDDRDDMPPYPRLRIDTEQHRVITEAGKWPEAVRAYLASINFVDAQIGRVLDALDASAHAANTIVVFYSDHGFHVGEKGAWGKATLWEESTRVPFIVVAPGVTPAGGVVTRAVSTLDIYPTLVELAGFQPAQQLDGLSLAGLLRDPVAGTRASDYAVTSYYFGNSIRDSRWRYTRYTPANPADGGEELYDHASDPDEHVNLAADPAHAATKATLAAALAQALSFGPSLRPHVAILAPADGAQLDGHDVVLEATALDPEDGDLSGAVQWSSDRDGPLPSPAELSPGLHALTARVADADGQEATAAVSVRVRDARDDVATTGAATTVAVDVLANDAGFADPVTVQLTAMPAQGTAVVTGSPGPASGIRVEYTPPEGFAGPVAFGYSVGDGTVADAAMVTVEVRPPESPAVVITAPAAGAQLDGHGIVLAATATDARDGDLSASVQWTSDRDGPIASPAELSVGAHVLAASVTDSDGNAATAQVAVRVREARDDAVETDAGVPVAIAVLANDLGFADPVGVVVTDPPASGAVTVTGSPGPAADLRLEYTPAPGFAGPVSFGYAVDDGSSQDAALVSVFVRPPVNLPVLAITAPAPGAQLDGLAVVLEAIAQDAEDGDLSGAVQWSSDVDGPLATPAALSAGPHLITATVADADGHVATAQVAVRVRAARDDAAEGDDTGPVEIDVLANDVGFADPVAVQVTAAPAAGSVEVVGSPGGRAEVRLRFVPPPGFAGVASFRYGVDDGASADTAAVQVRIRADRDGDGVDDGQDNCLGRANADQRDTNGDGFGNACDADLDDNGFVNAADLALFRLRFGSTDPDADFDGSGSVNAADLARMRVSFGAPPGPSALVP